MVSGEQFVPARITIRSGERVSWFNASMQAHTVTDEPGKAAFSGDAQLPPGASAFDSGLVQPRHSYSRLFAKPGTYRYFCIPHESATMTGTIVVLPATGARAPSSASSSAAAFHRGPVDPSLFPVPVFVALQRTGAIEELPSQRVFSGFPQAHYDAVDSRGNLLLISGFRTGDVYIASARTGRKRATLHVGGVIQGVNISPDGRYGLAVDAADGTVAVIDMRTPALLKSIRVGATPHNVAFSPDGSTAYVTLQGGQGIALLDMHALRLAGSITLAGLHPHNLDVTSSGRSMWVRTHAKPDRAGHVAVINLRSRQIERKVTVGLFHGGMDVRPNSRYAFTTDIGGDTVDVLDRGTATVVKRIVVGAGPHGVRLSPDAHWLYVAVTRANRVVVIDARTLRIAARIPTAGADPFWLAVTGND